MRVILYGLLSSSLEKALKSSFSSHSIEFVNEPLSEANAIPTAEIIVLKYNPSLKVDHKILDKMPKLKAIITASTGIDHIDIDECMRRNIIVKNCPTYATNAVAELALALLLLGLRNLPQACSAGKSLDYTNISQFNGGELEGKTCAVLGTGNIGTLVCKKLLQLGCTIIAYDVVERDSLKQIGVKYVNLSEALSLADVVILTLPLTKDTIHILDEQAFCSMKSGAGIVNVGRGELIDGEALYKSLSKLSFAALDVIEGEGELAAGKKSELLVKLSQHPKVILTPHIGARTVESEKRRELQIMEKLKEVLVELKE